MSWEGQLFEKGDMRRVKEPPRSGVLKQWSAEGAATDMSIPSIQCTLVAKFEHILLRVRSHSAAIVQ